ncbi:MAG: MlaD family protein [Bacteroidota bacterium]|nr:MlaD family protein [Bacteroidota bacterium]
MAKQKSAVKLGIFIFIGFAILVAAVYLIGGKSSLFTSTFTIKTYFHDIQGLKSGTVVRLSGIDAGSVSDIQIVPDNTGRVEVTLNLVTDVRRFIRIDTKASIETDGLVGNKVIVLKLGSESAPLVKDFGYIEGEEPLGFGAIIAETQGILKYTKLMTKNLADITNKVNNGEGTLGKILNDNELYNSATGLTKRADSSLRSVTNELKGITGLFDTLGTGVRTVVRNIDRVIGNVDSIIVSVKAGKGVIGQMFVNGSKLDTSITNTIQNVEKITSDTRLAASRLADNMEALKHNWLFKSYFEKRGYWEAGKAEADIDAKTKELNDKIRLLDQKIEQLKKIDNKK